MTCNDSENGPCDVSGECGGRGAVHCVNCGTVFACDGCEGCGPDTPTPRFASHDEELGFDEGDRNDGPQPNDEEEE